MKKINLFAIAPGAIVVSACGTSYVQKKSEDQFPVTPVMEIDTLSFTDYVAEIHTLQNVEIRARVNGYLENSILTRESTSLKINCFLPFLEVIFAQKNALQSQLELVNYRKRQNISLINLYRSLGGGWQ